MSTENLERYLNDHLAGAAGALVLVEELSQRGINGEESDFFRDLHEEIYADRELLVRLMDLANLRTHSLLQTVGTITAKVGRIKLGWEGLKPGELGMFETLEMLCVGIQGKRLLWHALAEIAAEYPEWTGVDFAALAATAKAQRDAVEQKRLTVSRQALARED